MTSFGTLLRLEFSKTIRRPMTWILAVIFIGFMAFMYTVLTFTMVAVETDMEGMEEFDTAGLEQQLFLPDSLSFGSSLIVGVGAVVMIVYAAGLFGSEFGWATIRMMLLMRAGRTRLVAAKIAMIVLMSALFTVIGLGIVLLGTTAAEIIVGDSGGIGDLLTADLFIDAILILLRSTLAIAMWALIGGMLALAFSSMPVGTGIALAAYFVGDLIVTLIGQLGSVGEWVSRVMPTYGINGLVQLNQVSPPDFSSAELAGIVASLIIWAAVFIALGLYRFRNMDVIAASN